MAIRKLLGYAALAAGIATGAQALASGVNGDIYDIRPCEYDGTTRGAWATADAPLSSGVTTYFKIRLIQGAKDDNDTTWFIDHVGLGSTIVDDALYPLQVGIYVSGKLRMATLVDSRPNSPASGFTELVFEYKTQPGDFAMPIVLATEAGPATASTGSTAYLFNRTDKWKITNNNAENCNLWFWEQGSGLGWPVADPEGGRVQDYSLARLAGLYVKTIDFDSKWEAARDSTDPLWRSVHQDSTITVGATPTLAAIAAASNNVTLYVWSTDDSAVRIRGGAPTDIVIGYDAGNPITTNTLVGSVTIAGGQVYQSFEIEGVSMTGGAGGDGKCELVLSPWPNYTYLGGTADRLIDYVTVPVKCVEPLPTTLIVNVENDPAYAKVGDGWKSYSTTLDVYLSQPLTEDIDVTITPSIAGHGELNMADYVKFSKTAPTVKTIASLSDTVTVTIPAGQLRSTTNPKIYVFFLKGDEFTSGGATIDFTPSISAAQQASTGLNTDDRFVAGGCEVVARPPEFVAPEEGSEIGATAGVAQEIEIEVADTYADQQIAAPADGYKIEVKYNDATGWKELDGSYYIGTGNLLRKADGTLPELTYTTSSASTSTGTFTTQIRVTEPINGNRAVVRLIATVAAPKTVAVTADADSYNEGASAKFTIQLNADNDTGAPLYAFLVAGPDTVNKDMFKALGRQCVITPDMTPADYPTTSGLVINPDNGGPGKEVIGTVKLLDGESEDVGGSSFYFTVKLCTTSYYDPGNAVTGDPGSVVTGYNSNYATIQVFNVEPTITRVEMNGYEPLDDGYFDGKYPVGQAQTFQAIVKDAGGFDLDNGFHTRWTITRVGGGVQIPVDDIVGNPNEDANKKTVTFVQAGTYKIKVQVHDKDMEDWAAAYNETFVVVVAQPQLSVEMPDTPDENLTRQKLMVSLGGYYNAAEPMVVMITVIPPSTTSVNPGVLTFDSAYATIPAGFEALADAAIAAEGSAAYPHYFMSFSGTEGQEISVLEMDGTVLSLSPGFSVKAQVLNNGVSSDPAKTWAEYYLPTTQRFYINNVAPVCVVTEPSTSRWEVAGGAATSYPIRWTVRSDVDNDYDGLWDDGVTRGIKVSFSGCDNADDGLTYVTSRTTGTSGVFVPNFGSAQGDQVVTLTIEDKDGGYTTWTYLYTVAASKFLTTIANGPNGGTTTSPLSRKYSLLGRDVFGSLGQGHTWVESATFSSAKNFRLRWNCGKNPSATIYAFGYKVTAPDDNGTLDAGMDIAVDTTGYAVAGTPVANPYHYPFADYAADSDDRKDSFFYCWLQHSSGADGGSMTSTVLGGAITPETPGAVASGRVDLPTEQTQDKNYLDSEVEAIFSREWMPADNCGDINADGVPDAYAMAVWKGGNLIELMDGDILENDLMDLAGANPDEDYLPGVYRGAGGTALVNGSDNSYAPIGSPFSSRLEFRGFRSGLNARDLARSDISFIDVLLRDSDPEYDVEERAWQKYAADNGLDPDADRSLDNWSPEPRSARYARMDPTLEDTDADKFPDGWEYYFWYMAKVWLPAHQQEAKDGDIGVPRSGQHFVFERFTLDNIVVGEEISAADVMARFDPCSPYNGSNHDFDNDGLSDLEELALGTNPCHWDTDGDRMCDGWEVMMCLDPLNGSKRDNPDGDYMAYRSVRLDMCWIDPASADPANLDANGAVVDKYAEGLRIYGLPGLQQGVDYDTDMTGKYVMLQTVDVVCYSFTPKYLNGDRLVYGLREDIPLVIPQDWVWGWYMVDEVRCETITMNAGEEIFTDLEYVLIHDQVRDGFGFDPRTGWGRNGNGYVTDRWDPNHNARNVSLFDETGLAVNTRAYETYDEYLVMKYRLDYGIDYAP